MSRKGGSGGGGWGHPQDDMHMVAASLACQSLAGKEGLDGLCYIVVPRPIRFVDCYTTSFTLETILALISGHVTGLVTLIC